MSDLAEHLDRLEAYFAGIHTCDMEEPEAVALLHTIDAARKWSEVEATEPIWWCFVGRKIVAVAKRGRTVYCTLMQLEGKHTECGWVRLVPVSDRGDEGRDDG